MTRLDDRAGRTRWELISMLVLLAGGFVVRERIAADHWVFAGADTYGYLALADEWRLHGRYALGPAPEPLHYGRMPLYPIFLAVVKGDARAEMSGGEGWERIKRTQRWLDLLVALPLVYLMARKLAGVAAGLVALALAALCPITALFTAAALTESLAATLSVATIAPLVLGTTHPRRWFPVSGALVAASTLVRPDGVFLAVAFVPALLAIRGGRERRVLAATALAGFAAVYSPWPIRNLHQFGQPHLVGAHVDLATRVLPRSIGWWSWRATWSDDNLDQAYISTCFYNPPCAPDLNSYPAKAFDDADERVTVDRILALRTQQGLSPAVFEGFRKLAFARFQRHPLRCLAWLPLMRLWHMWVAPHDELLQLARPAPVLDTLRRWFHPGSAVLFLAILAAGTGLSLDGRTRWPALVLFVPILFRSAVLSYVLHTMPRYTAEVMPLGFVLVATGLVRLMRSTLGTSGRHPDGENARTAFAV